MEENKNPYSKIIVVMLSTILFLLLCVTSLLLFKKNTLTMPNSKLAMEQREYANMLKSQGLYKQAIEAYRRYLSMDDLDTGKQANIHFVMANMLKEKLHTYDEAMAEYLKVKQLAPESTLIPEINRSVVECLERMNRSMDAQRTLHKAVSLKKEEREKAEAVNVVAKIEDKIITLQDLNDEIQKLPPSMQKKYSSPNKKLEFLKQYIAKEILFDTAIRNRYDQDPSIQKALEQLRKELLVQKLMNEEVQRKVQISEGELKLYYEANKNRYTAKDQENQEKNYPSLRKQLETDLQKEKEQIAYQELMQKALQAQNVEIYDYYFKKEIPAPYEKGVISPQ